MPVTGDTAAVAIVTYKAVPLSMGDCFIKVIPGELFTTYEVRGQFAAFDSASLVAVSGAVRAAAEDYLQDVVDTVGGIATTQEIDGPLGRRVIVGAGFTAGDLVNPFSAQTYTGLFLTGVDSEDEGGKHFGITYTFIKPISTANDGTSDSTVLFNATQIGNRGGKVSISADGSAFRIQATSQYVGANPLTYLETLANTLGLNSFVATPIPRGTAGNRLALNSYNSIIGTFEWTGKGTISSAVVESMEASEETPGILNISTSLVARR